MSGFTTIKLKDCSAENIEKQNNVLINCGVPKKYHFYSENDMYDEYIYFTTHKEQYKNFIKFPEKIKTYNQFKLVWNTKKLTDFIVPEYGMLTFDCYFNRTSKRAMHNLAKYLLNNLDEIESINGSFSTFIEKCGYGDKNQKKLLLLTKKY